jgi:hypothetical protein
MADDPETPPASKLTRSKQRWAQQGRFLTGKVRVPNISACRQGST